MESQDTIAAVATPVGIGGIGVIKISGSLSQEVADKLFQKKRNGHNPCLRPYHLHLGEIINPSTREVVDEVLLAYMPGPASYTREVASSPDYSLRLVVTQFIGSDRLNGPKTT